MYVYLYIFTFVYIYIYICIYTYIYIHGTSIASIIAIAEQYTSTLFFSVCKGGNGNLRQSNSSSSPDALRT